MLKFSSTLSRPDIPQNVLVDIYFLVSYTWYTNQLWLNKNFSQKVFRTDEWFGSSEHVWPQDAEANVGALEINALQQWQENAMLQSELYT